MKHNIMFIGLVLFTVCFMSLPDLPQAICQEKSKTTSTDSTKGDTLKKDVKSPVEERTTENKATDETVSAGEIFLGEIKIEAVVETPSVAIVPKRLDPNFGKMEFMDRSFETELKAIPTRPMLLGNEMKGVNKIKKNSKKKIKTAPKKK